MLLLGAIVSGVNTGFNPSEFIRSIPNLVALSYEMFPPDTALLPTAFWAILETLQIAFLGTILGAILAVPLSLLASRNLFSRAVYTLTRTLLAAIRTIPALLWAVLFVIMVGLGPHAGVLATMMYSVGYLSKLQYEAVEAMDPEPYEAMSAISRSKLKLIHLVVIPSSAPHLVSQLLFMFEYNVRASTILGFVGAGGIGFYIANYLRLLEYDKVLTFLVIVLLSVLIIDYTSLRLRDKYIVPMLKIK